MHVMLDFLANIVINFLVQKKKMINVDSVKDVNQFKPSMCLEKPLVFLDFDVKPFRQK